MTQKATAGRLAEKTDGELRDRLEYLKNVRNEKRALVKRLTRERTSAVVKLERADDEIEAIRHIFAGRNHPVGENVSTFPL